MTRKRSTTTPPDAAALLRYVSGESPLAEADWIRRWAAADKDREASIAELHDAWQRGTLPVEEWNSAPLWSRIESEMDRASSESLIEKFAPTSQRFSFAPYRDRGDSFVARRLAYAVAALLILAVTATGIVRTRHDNVPAPVTHAMREVTTTRGETATLSLADGSTVTLAPGSTLRIPTNFGSAAREAVLEGEAVFSVKHDATRSFRVRTRTSVTEDLGTRFVVRAYVDDSTSIVAVAEGAVTLRGSEPTSNEARRPPTTAVILRAGDLAELQSDGAIGARRGTAVSDYFSWTARRLTFTHTPLPEVVRVLSRWYDLDIRLDPRLSSHQLTADFSVESATEMLRVLQIALNVQVERQGHLILLTPPGPSQ
jgi:transmembrane sensor